MTRDLYIYFDSAFHTPEPVFMGILHADMLRGKEVFSFAFDEQWLKNPLCRLLDPDLQLYRGHQYVDIHKPNFGIFLDSSPDRWGRVLLDKREVMSAREEERPARLLHESDYLTGVFDESRMGALRVKKDLNGPFVDNDNTLAAPPFSEIRQLEYASLQLEKDASADANRWIKMLIAPGSSLGGARPKANVRDEQGNLWIAKFPSQNDSCDVGAWEAVCFALAKRCGIDVPDFQIKCFNSHFHTFLSRRFDRLSPNCRVHFTSAMTMLGYCDGVEDVSYLEIAEWIAGNCCHVQDNLHELFRRIVFNIAVGNTDDHLRNHGFVLSPEGWSLSPAYDLNPNEYGDGLSLAITESDNRRDMNLVREVAPYFELTKEQSEQIISHIGKVVSSWREVATAYHIPREQQNLKSAAFMTI